MIPRIVVVAAFAAAAVLAGAWTASAHGLGGRADLPVPLSFFVWGAAVAIVVSFLALGALWRTPRLEEANETRPLPDGLQRILRSTLLEWVVRGVSLTLFVLVTLAALIGPASPSRNIAPLFVYVWFWVGLAFLHAVFGNLWATLSPWDTLARLVGIGGRPRRSYPKAWGKWPAALLLLSFVWLELAYPEGASARVVGLAIVAYTLVTLTGTAVFGREAWGRDGEAFAVYFGLLARLSPVTRDDDGRGVLRRPLGGLPGLAPQPDLALVSATAIWYVQVAAIVLGHMGGVLLAHDRAVALFPTLRAVRTQYALLAVMVLLTVGGLVLLSGS